MKSPTDPTHRSPDDETTAHDLEAPTYDQAPQTIEARPSPFHHLAGQFAPKITSKTPTSPGASGEVVLVPPVVLGASEFDAMAGPTAPDGHPISGSFDAPGTDPGGFQPGPWIDATPTMPGALMPSPVPQVPAPDAPKILVSQSLMLEAETTTPSHPMPPERPPRRRHDPQYGPGPHAPTEVALPAIKRKKARDKEGSDLPLIFGLIAIGLLIAIMVAVTSYFVVRSVVPGVIADPPPVARPG